MSFTEILQWAILSNAEICKTSQLLYPSACPRCHNKPMLDDLALILGDHKPC